MAPIEIASIAKDCFLAGAGCATVAIAYFGLSTWQRQLQGTTDFVAAKELIQATYALRDEVLHSRSRMITAGEFPPDYFSLPKSDRVEGDAYSHVYGNRWKPVEAALSKFDARALEAEALWGGQVRTAAQSVSKALLRLRISMSAMVTNAYSGGLEFRNDPDHAVKIRRDVSASADDQDELSLAMRAAIALVEVQVRPHLRKGV